ARGDPRALPDVGGGLGPRRAVVDLDDARMGDAPDPRRLISAREIRGVVAETVYESRRFARLRLAANAASAIPNNPAVEGSGTSVTVPFAWKLHGSELIGQTELKVSALKFPSPVPPVRLITSVR